MPNRAALLGCGLLLLAFLSASFLASSAQGQRHGASASIVNGSNASIADWPWQVALTEPKQTSHRQSTSERFFCGGSVLAPTLVITAGHCVVDLSKKEIQKLEIVSGRSNLNSNQGQVVRVSGLHMPVNSSGKRRYRTIDGAADWDVALLTLASPLAATPIKLAGPDEASAWSPGRQTRTAGWGLTAGFGDGPSPQLRFVSQVLMGKGLCRRAHGYSFQSTRMVCVGGPGGHTSACNGDSGGPLVVKTSDGYRLVGLTSWGSATCSGAMPSVFARIAGDPMRSWVAQTALTVAGADVLGTGGLVDPALEWCRIPALRGLRPSQARQRLAAAGCRLGKVRSNRWTTGRSGRIVVAGRLPGWLAPPKFKLDVWVPR